jgi:CTP:molybdopterin cytidylyltransferase MocA
MTLADVGIIILAAGSSSRMQTSKQLLEIDGRPMLAGTVEQALMAGVQKIVVVLGANENAHRTAIANYPVQIVYNSRWELGMGSSLKTGLGFIKKQGVAAVIILVCDQPALSSDIIKSLLVKHNETRLPIVASRYGKTVGVPVLFSSAYFDTISTLDDEQGAKKIILQHSEDVATIDFPSGEIDLDTPEDFNNFIANNHS